MMNRDDSSSKDNTNQRTSLVHSFYANLKQILDGIPKLACVIVTVWDYFHTRDIERSVFFWRLATLLSYSLPKLKALAPRIGTLARAIAELLDKVK